MASIPVLRLSLSTATAYPPYSLHPRVTARLPLPLALPHPLRSDLTVALPTTSKSRSRLKTSISSSYTPTPATDRLISAAAYFLPFFNGLQYGRFLFAQYPSLGVAFQPILPLLSLYRSVPYASFVAFFALYLGVVRNPNFSRYVRFNSMQAVVLDVLLVLPLFFQRIFNPGRAGLAFKLMVMSHNALFLFIVFCFLYSLIYSILGRTPYLPFVAEAAGRQM
ncbi:hypothetical protein NMG60_11011750 [Bertholletia excelsa]